MQLIIFALVAVAAYFLSDFALLQIESLAGRRLEQRSAIFFVLLLATTLIAFALVRWFAPL